MRSLCRMSISARYPSTKNIGAGTLPAARIADPQWLAHRYDPGHDAVHLIAADRAMRSAATFLTDEFLPTAAAPIVAPRQQAIDLVPRIDPVHFIFHSAYCCSTLLAQVLDRAGLASTLKEPLILNDLIGWRHRGGNPAKVAGVLDSVLTLLSRGFVPGEAVIIKPSNVVNALAPTILTMRPEARAVLLYAPLRVFLTSIARKGMWGRLWVRELLAKQLADGMVDLGFAPEDYFRLTDLQVAAVGWIAQADLFAALASRFPGRVRSLQSETLLAAPLGRRSRDNRCVGGERGVRAQRQGRQGVPCCRPHARTDRRCGIPCRGNRQGAGLGRSGRPRGRRSTRSTEAATQLSTKRR
jgi:hypothetical protein